MPDRVRIGCGRSLGGVVLEGVRDAFLASAAVVSYVGAAIVVTVAVMTYRYLRNVTPVSETEHDEAHAPVPS